MKGRYDSNKINLEILKEVEKLQGEGFDIEKCCKKLIAAQTLCRWNKEYRSILTLKSIKIRELRKENFSLKKLVADLSFDNVMLKELAKDSEQELSVKIECGDLISGQYK